MREGDHRRSTSEDSRQDRPVKRKKWIKTLCVHSSDEDNSDVRTDIKIDTCQLLAIRFPYPMVSDDSDDEEDLNNFPVGLNTVVPTDKKRKYISSSSDEKSKLVHKRKKKKLTHEERIVLQNIEKETVTTENDELKHCISDSKQLKNSGYYNSMNRAIHSSSSDENVESHKKNKLPDTKTEDASKVSNISSLVNSNSKLLPEGSNSTNMTCVKINREDEVMSKPKKPMKNSRFLDSSTSETSDEEEMNQFKKKSLKSKRLSKDNYSTRYRRLHMLSPSSSDNDKTEVSKTEESSKDYPHKLTIDSTIQSSTKTTKNSHFLSSSSEEDDDKDSFVRIYSSILYNENKELPQIKSKDTLPHYDLGYSFNETDSQQLMNEEVENNSTQVNTNKPTPISNICNSNAWKQIANSTIRRKNNPQNQNTSLKIQNLKKNFVISNISSFEIHKQIQNKPLSNNNQEKQTSSEITNLNKTVSPLSYSGLKNMSSENTITSQENCRQNEIKNTENKDERRQPLENKRNTNVSSQNISVDSSGSSNTLNLSTTNQLVVSDNPTISKNTTLCGNKNNTTENNKKIRIEQMKPKINKSPKKSLSLLNKTKSSHIKKTFSKMKDSEDSKSKGNEIATISNECDVLGNILSQMTKMTNIPYKIEKPTKRLEETKTDTLCWPPNPIIMGTNSTQRNSQIAVQNGVHSSLLNSSSNTIVSTSSTPNSTFLLSKSKTDQKNAASNISTTNKKNATSNISTTNQKNATSNISTTNNNINLQEKLSGDNTRGSVIMKFYSADSQEYTSENPERANNMQQGDQLGLQNTNNCNEQVSNIKTKDQEEQSDKKQKEFKETLIRNKVVSSNNIQIDSNKSIDCIEEKSDQSNHSKLTEVTVEKPVKPATNDARTTESIPEGKERTARETDNNISGNDNTKGVRIKFGGTVFRLPGKMNSSNISEMPTTVNASISTLDQIGETSSNRGKLKPDTDDINLKNGIRPIANIPKGQNATDSEESETSSDSSDDDSDKSSTEESSTDSLDSSSESTNSGSTYHQHSSRNVLVPKSSNGSLKNSTMPIKESKKEINLLKNINDIEVITLSDSSDYENSTKNTEVSNTEIIKNIDKSVKSIVSNPVNNINDSNFIGKIRVKSFRDLGINIEKPIPDNALPTVYSVTRPVNNTQPDLQVKQSTSVNIESPSVCDAGSNQMTQSTSSNLNQHIAHKDLVSANVQSSINSDITSSIPSTSTPRITNIQNNKKHENVGSTMNSVISQPSIPSTSEPRKTKPIDTTKHVESPVDPCTAPAYTQSTSKPRKKTLKVNHENIESTIGSVISQSSLPSATKPRKTKQINKTKHVQTTVDQVTAQAHIQSTSIPRKITLKVNHENIESTINSVIAQASKLSASKQKKIKSTRKIKHAASTLDRTTGQASAQSAGITKSKANRKHVESTINSVISQSASRPKIRKSTDIPEDIRLTIDSSKVTQPSVSSAVNNLNSTISSGFSVVDPLITEPPLEPSQIKDNVAAQQASMGTENLFYDLCDTLFIDIVLMKIPKLVDDLHLAIIHDRIKEERLKKLDQLISPETIDSEKRRAARDFGEMLRVRAQSFVPLFMTIVNKITKDNFKTLITALYCRIVHQLEGIEHNNIEYRFKLKEIIKCMLQKHYSPGIEKVLSVFNSDELTFIANFNFVDQLLIKYDNLLDERQRQALQNETNNTQSSNTTINSENISRLENVAGNVGSKVSLTKTPVGLLTAPSTSQTGAVFIKILQPKTSTANVTESNNNQPNSLNWSNNTSTTTSTNLISPNSLIGNLDSLIFKKNSAVKNTPR